MNSLPAVAVPAIALGDSLTAEYEYLGADQANGYPIRGFDTEATDYAKITDPDREWISMSWVEVLGRLRGGAFQFGEWRSLQSPWAPPRLSGFERNWAVPGAKASQYEEFMTAGLSTNPLLYGFRVPLDLQLRGANNCVFIWLGANDLRANYGTIYHEDNDETRDAIVEQLGNGLIDDFRAIIDQVQRQNPNNRIVIGNLPNLAASPKVRNNHPIPEQRKRVTAATKLINDRILELAFEEGVAVADIFAETQDILAGEPFSFGAIQFTDEVDPDNDPHSLFTRDGFHPNTALQIEISRIFLRTYNASFGAAIPQITHAEALKLLKISPREPYVEWITNPQFGLPRTSEGLLKDPDFDRLTNLMEYAFGTHPATSDAAALPFVLTGPVPEVNAARSVTYSPATAPRPDIDIAVQYRIGTMWRRVAHNRLIDNGNGTFTAAIPESVPADAPLRIKVNLLPPQGSLNTISSAYRFE